MTHSPPSSTSIANFPVIRRGLWIGGCCIFFSLGCQWAGRHEASLPTRHSVQAEQLLMLSDIRLSKDHPLFQDLNQLRQDVAKQLHLPLDKGQVVVYLFSDEEKYSRYIETTFPGLPPRRAYFVGTPEQLAVYTYWGDHIQEDLRHEFTHGLLHAALKDVPLWLDEGIAEYYEIAGPDPGVNLEYAQRLSLAIEKGWRPDIRRLEDLENVREMSRDDYQESWAWVHFMLHGSPDGQLVLLTYLQDLQETSKPGRLSDRLQAELPDVEARLLSYLSTMATYGTASVTSTDLH